jgi:hypothetical protein
MQRGADLVRRAERGIWAVALRQVPGKEPSDSLFVDIRQRRLFQTKPAREVGSSFDVTVLCPSGISAVTKAGKEYYGMRIQDALLEPTERLWMDDEFVHNDLL